ncbi:uncharacterized protein LOC128225142 isoform X3 [Mya arenaria]|uniref:uncharacterized protein LOC128207638 isoform X3 n=1 Tax=Mya arenaria TaxID=6604 RepID=UPI0022E66DB1|nr:uncharacterized protein LOC128207638 isoform X3 [Mya arenaria]XP_052791145.1 uncharacterized protein LOC128225142 isoform X3 [Mya arenaria]
MAGTAYHMEALRKTRAIERKTEAMKRLRDSVGQQTYNPSGSGDTDGAPLVFSEPGHYAQNRSSHIAPPIAHCKDEVVFEEVVHDPNFKYRMLKASGFLPSHVDPIYKIMYPGGTSRK